MQQELQRMQAQEQAARNQPPWVQLATALSANLAQAPNMPGWVQGLGRTAAQLNPQPDQIRAQRLALMEKGAGIAEKGLAFQMANQRESRLVEEEARKKTEDKARDIRIARTGLMTAAQKGELTDPALTSQMLQDGGVPKAVADVQAKAFVGVSQEKKALVEAAQKETNTRAANDLRERARESDARLAMMAKALTVKTADKSESDKAIEAVAQSLAAGDLSSIRDVSSFRGDQRIRIFARAKELNPRFSTGEINRKIKMEDSFTNGKDGQSLQSFGTFLEHAGELAESLKTVSQSSSPALNKPINWIRKNASGNPEYQRLLVAIEPVGKEFESFLLNQRALYVDDRKRIDVLMNGNSSPAQIMAALNQMGKTAKDRYTEMNHRYKRVMGQDLQNPFGEEAIAGAAKVGINLGTPQAGQGAGTVKVTEDELKKLGFK